ncbi:phosphoenolpyruvate--protein phosphotransferase [Gorillibacterium sp. sgz5001074]|uniref:phosphoenolpyruvate--protein phosphotransferase n=1 Tax=Gorillibacterium sp. sgz5001074 TaxID=3446695 RepID=UPI003F675C48
MTEIRYQGIGVSAGVRIGTAFVYNPVKPGELQERKADNAEEELTRLRHAKARCLSELEELVERTRSTLGEEKAAILKGQISFLNDPTFYPPMEQLISKDAWSAETAVGKIVARIAAIFENMPNDYMKERAADIRDVGGRLTAKLVGNGGNRLTDIKEPSILIAEDLTPSDTVQLDPALVLGFMTRIGGKTSHTAILANSLGIPAVLGLGNALDGVPDGATVILDGSTGECLLHPEAATVERYRSLMLAEREELERLKRFSEQPAVTSDGFRVEIAANIGTPAEAESLLQKGAEAVGLYRTEFLFMSRTVMPDENTQFQAYKAAAQAMQGKPVVIRTLDIGGDKELPYLELPHELNPFLGYRAVRLTLDRPDLFRTQLRAIYRASAFGTVKIMFPMISGLGEWRRAKALAEEVRQELAAEGQPMGEKVELGIMVEIPSAALLAPQFAKEVDFFSIGTNDLVQYTVAVDRMNEKVANLYDYFHPAVIRLIKTVIDASNRAGIWTGMCGSMAGDPLAAPLLVGLGLHEWSMSPSALHRVKETVTRLNRQDCIRLAERILELETPEEVRQALQEFLGEYSR